MKAYPFVTYDQEKAPNYYSEEILFFEPTMKNIHVSDRATKMSLIRSTNAFSIGVDLPNFNQDIYFRRRNTEMVAIPFEDQTDLIQVGYLIKNGRLLSPTGAKYVHLLVEHIDKLKMPLQDEP